MNSKWVIPFVSAMDNNQKRQILSNELCRRLSRTDPLNHDDQAPGVINFFDRKLVYSGYQYQHRVRIIEGGISADQRKLEASKSRPFYRTAEETLGRRNQSKLLSKTSWYKGKIWKQMAGVEHQEAQDGEVGRHESQLDDGGG